MKKVLVAVALLLSVSSFSGVFAAEANVDSVAICCVQATQDEYTNIEISDVPDVVKAAIEKAYPGQTIKSAAVAEKEGVKTYKLVLASTEGTESTVIFNDKGEEIK
ncbi:hypothetical protein [Parabacteroides bouchesdurhonensis]|uniref:hypothetical protein n=1 Tax=Parabacteroides bouchesdurhonensis TaxID=1936995 RepID=UPI000E4818DE|nr:hypothetical protein [Parabacteroides bouchesdurhonensis]RHJ90393.1 hypothetical protein DW095_13025 [Bacteroides sp. AM07-16]